tara:strand:- start:882 stop:2645 length:1764 start_codon:yes stop_codon:yes gene_type:complete
MACSNCNTQSCGCASGTYVVSQTCPPACSEVFNSACIVYTGVDITCTDSVSGLTSTVVSRNDYLDTVITNIVNYMCARFNPATLPSSVVVSGDAFVVVNANTVGYVTTYTVTLDPAGLPSASIVTAGDNVVVTGTGAALDPYVVNANESIVAVDPASALTLVVDPSTPGPYETTYTIGIDNSLLPVTELQTSFGHISITALPNTPNAGDTTYTLEVDEVTISTSDAKLDVVNTAAGGIAPFERTFTIDIDDVEMGNFIMDTAGANIVGTGGITVAYDAIAHQITIGETIGTPDQWKIISDGITDITAGSPTDKLRVVAGTGASVALASGPGANEATFTVTNTDLGSDQLIFGTVAVLGQPNVLATTNTDTLTLVEGANIGITTDAAAKSVTITNEIDHVYSDVIADSGGTLQAGSTTSTLEIKGGTGISTVGAAGPNNEITINNTAEKWTRFDADSGTTSADDVADILTVSGGAGIETSIAGDTLTIVNVGVTSAVAGDGISVSGATGAVTITADVQRQLITGVGYTAGAVAATITHTLGETYVQVRAFDGTTDVTNDGPTIISLLSATQFTVSNATRNITDILVIG